MFCYQCEETVAGKGCTMQGVCGKASEVADLQDKLIRVCEYLGRQLAGLRPDSGKEADMFMIESLFSTITNANFDREYFAGRISEGIGMLKTLGMDWKDEAYGPLSEPDEDIRSLRWTIIYGLKGMAAYMYHSDRLGYYDDEIIAFMEKALSVSGFEKDKARLLETVDETGAFGLRVMELLHLANTTRFGKPAPVKAGIAVRDKPGILISGHDLHDLDLLLQQTEGKGIDVYTHGEMLPANAYPYFARYSHLAGNYGGSWWKQAEEFEAFGGPIILTTNCLVPPKDSYKDRVFATGVVGHPGLKRIGEDFREVIELALTCKPPEKLDEGSVTVGFGLDALIASAPRIIELVSAGKIKRFIVMAGCDGRHKDRSYYAEYAAALPKDTVILTAGCAKYRYNKIIQDEIEGIPRVIDAGQCNDSYTLIRVALALKDALGLPSVNDLPITYNIAWYEQKAALILLTLLHLGVKDITLGPRLPAFLSPNVLAQIAEKTGLRLNRTVKEDLELHGLALDIQLKE